MISFIVCNFNNIKFIEKCINSILEISNIEYEIICVDDCSTDSSQKMISQKFCRNSKIKIVFLNQNVGTFNARKIGVQNCNGDYIYFVDSDDWISSNFFNRSLFYFLYKKHKDIYFSKIFLNRHLNLYFIPNEYTFDPPKDYYSIEELLINFFSIEYGPHRWGPHGGSCKIFKTSFAKNVYEQIGNINKKLCFAEDVLFVIVYLDLVRNFQSINLPSYFYRKNFFGTTQKITYMNKKHFLWSLSQLDTISKILKKISFRSVTKDMINIWIKHQYFYIYNIWRENSKSIFLAFFYLNPTPPLFI